MAEHKMLKAEELEVGMKVAYPYAVSSNGYGRYFRYRLWVGYEVKRITPKRTKAVLMDAKGQEREVDLRRYNFFALDTSMQSENKMVEMYRKCGDILLDYRMNKWKPLGCLPDDDLKAVHPLLVALDVIMRKEKE